MPEPRPTVPMEDQRDLRFLCCRHNCLVNINSRKRTKGRPDLLSMIIYLISFTRKFQLHAPPRITHPFPTGHQEKGLKKEGDGHMHSDVGEWGRCLPVSLAGKQWID